MVQIKGKLNTTTHNKCYSCSRHRVHLPFGLDIYDKKFNNIVIEKRYYCSNQCMETNMDWQPREEEAISYARKAMGQYIVEQGFNGWMEMTKENLDDTLKVFLHNYHEFLATGKVLDDDIPF